MAATIGAAGGEVNRPEAPTLDPDGSAGIGERPLRFRRAVEPAEASDGRLRGQAPQGRVPIRGTVLHPATRTAFGRTCPRFDNGRAWRAAGGLRPGPRLPGEAG